MTPFSHSHLGFFLMSSNWPTTWDTFVRTILKAISSSPMISNLPDRGHVSQEGRISENQYNVGRTRENLLVFILVPEGFVDALCDGFAVEDEAFCDGRLWNNKSTL